MRQVAKRRPANVDGLSRASERARLFTWLFSKLFPPKKLLWKFTRSTKRFANETTQIKVY